MRFKLVYGAHDAWGIELLQKKSKKKFFLTRFEAFFAG
jgi:hypothetical protein